MKIKLTHPDLPEQVLLVDRETKLAEFGISDEVEIVGLSWNGPDATLNINFALGARLTDGTFKRDPNSKVYMEKWGKDRTPAIWDKYYLSNPKSLDFDAVKSWIVAEHIVKFACRDLWKMPDATIEQIQDIT